jgi:hypothetical protein
MRPEFPGNAQFLSAIFQGISGELGQAAEEDVRDLHIGVSEGDRRDALAKEGDVKLDSVAALKPRVACLRTQV